MLFCAVHKAAADAERDKDCSGSPPENQVHVPLAVPVKNRFGSRRTPNVDPELVPGLLVTSSVHFSTMRVLRVPSMLLAKVMTQTTLFGSSF